MTRVRRIKTQSARHRRNATDSDPGARVICADADFTRRMPLPMAGRSHRFEAFVGTAYSLDTKRVFVYMCLRVFDGGLPVALKDLVAQKAALAEDAIEEIVADYVRFDPDEKAIAFTPAAAKLQNRAKVLIYLVALQGWPFVSDESVPVDAKPAEIGEHVGIQGGTLRPILKELKDRHMITEKGGRYFVRAVTLSAIKAELGENEAPSKAPRARPKRRRDRKADVAPKSKIAEDDPTNNARRMPKKKSRSLSERFEKWIDGGFFDKPRTLAEVQKRFHQEGMIVPRTSIPSYLLKAVRSRRLTREEGEVNKKRVWVYQRSADQ